MKRTSCLIAFLLCAITPKQEAAASGFASRELNPMLQPVFLPSRVPVSATDGWRLDHNLFITNTLQSETADGERLIIDFENYRYQFDLSHRRKGWITHVSIPLMATRGGSLDNVIEEWHDLFGFPNGKRDDFEQDQIFIGYRRDGEIEYLQTDESEGLGDIAFTLGYQPTGHRIGWFVAIELPSGSADDFTGNEAIDLALWLNYDLRINDRSNAYGMFGVTFPADDGNLEGLIVDEIWVAQVGFDYRFYDDYVATAQLDLHSKSIEDSDFRAFNESYQLVLGVGFLRLMENHRLDLFFTEDIHVRSAPDITFGLRLSREF